MSLAPSASPSVPYSFPDCLVYFNAAIISMVVAFLVALPLTLYREFYGQPSSINHNVPGRNIALGLRRNPSSTPPDALDRYIELVLRRNMVEIVYKRQEGEGDDGVKDCCICLEEFGDGECCMVLCCNHSYHRDCIRLWLRRSRRCPLCRKSVRGSFH